jgi:hypothetical protein
MRRLSIWSVVMTICTGCGGHSASSPDAEPSGDAAIDASGPATKIAIALSGMAPALIAYRDGVNGAWQTPAATSTGYEMTVHGPYVMSYTCERPNDNVATHQVARTPEDDARDLFAGCNFTPGPTVHVIGQMVQPGSVAVGGTPQRSTAANWSFDIAVEPSTYDVIASTADRIEIRRGLAIAGATSLTPAFDLEANGTDLVVTPFTVTGAASDDRLSQATALATARGFAMLPDDSFGDLAMQRAVPRTSLVDGEFHKLLISAFAFSPTAGSPDATRRVRRRWNQGQSTAFALPPRLGPVSYADSNGTLVATWSTVPDFYGVQGLVESHAANGTKVHKISVEASKRFIDATAANLRFEVDIPGFKSQWRLDYTKEYTREITTLTSRGETMDDRDEVVASQTVNAGQPPAANHTPVPPAPAGR